METARSRRVRRVMSSGAPGVRARHLAPAAEPAGKGFAP
jgi:hypothetical protein